MTTRPAHLSKKIADIQEQFFNGLFDETAYTERIRQLNAAMKPSAWQRYQDALVYTDDMRARGYYETEAAYQQSRLTAWQQYLDAPYETAA